VGVVSCTKSLAEQKWLGKSSQEGTINGVPTQMTTFVPAGESPRSPLSVPTFQEPAAPNSIPWLAVPVVLLFVLVGVAAR
jgi:hypothetical protein